MNIMQNIIKNEPLINIIVIYDYKFWDSQNITGRYRRVKYKDLIHVPCIENASNTSHCKDLDLYTV